MKKSFVNTIPTYFRNIKAFFILTITMILIFACVGCANKDANSDSNNGVVTISDFREAAKQEAINECCNYSNVSKVNIEFGTFDINTNGEYWEADMAGYFYPVDKHGEYGDRYLFEINVSCPKGSLYPMITDPKIRKKVY